MQRIPAVVVMVSIIACVQQAPKVDLAQEEAAIRSLLDQSTRGLTEHNWSRYSEFWKHAPDIEVMHPAAAEWIVGWDSVATKYQRMIGDTATNISVSNKRQRIHLSPLGDMAWVTQEDVLRVGPTGKESEIVQWSTAVYEKRGDSWRLVHAHASLPARSNR